MASKQPSKQFKVCLVAISLGKGGKERSTALLSRMLTKSGFNVFIVILNNKVDYSYAGNLFNLGTFKTDNDTLSKRLSRFKKLKRFFKEEDFDFIIDTRSRGSAIKELFYLYYLYKKQHIIYLAHSFNTPQYFTKRFWIGKKMVDKAVAIVGVSKAITRKINEEYATNKAITIYNPSEPFTETEKENPFSEKYILYLGRIEEKVKNFTLLLAAYKASNLVKNGIYLKIVGDGSDTEFVKQKVKDLKLSNTVDIYPFTPEIVPYLKNALYLTLTSRYEGFPMVLIESLSLGTPVLSVACESGPDEIIIHRKNGLLVENFSEKALAEAMNNLAFNGELYKTCKLNAKKSVSHLKMETIAAQWTNLLNSKKHKLEK